jgi:hypothetical protein
MLFIMLPTGHLRYFLPLSLIVGGSVSGYLTLFQRPVVLGLALVGCSPSPCCPSRQWSFQIAALGWVKANRPAAVLYSDSLRRHASLYWCERLNP